MSRNCMRAIAARGRSARSGSRPCPAPLAPRTSISFSTRACSIERVEHRVRQPQALGELRAAALAGDQRLQHQLRERVGVEARSPPSSSAARRCGCRRALRALEDCDGRAHPAISCGWSSAASRFFRRFEENPVPDASCRDAASRPGFELEHARGAAARQANPPGLQRPTRSR